MKKPFNPVIPDYTPKGQRKVEEETLPPRACMVCHKATQGYGVFREGYVCSRKCNDTFTANRPSLIDHATGENHETLCSAPGDDDGDGDGRGQG